MPGKPKPLPEEIAAVQLKCIVCTDAIPEQRVRRRKDTCSAACYNLLLHYRKSLYRLWNCPTCLSPNTPEEREEFKLWRQSRGRRSGPGRPPKEDRAVKPVDTETPERDSISADSQAVQP